MTTDKKEEAKNPDEMFVDIRFNMKTGAFSMKSDSPTPVMTMGVLSFGLAQLGKPKAPAIQVAQNLSEALKHA